MAKYTDSIADYNYACAIVQDPYFYDLGIEYYRVTQRMKFEKFPVLPNQNLDTRLDSFDSEGGSVSIKIYRDKSRSVRSGGDACIVYAHGGGFIGGGFELVDGLCQDFVFDLGVTVIAIDYRIAPEFLHPTALHDCLAGILHIRNKAASYGIDPERIFIGGESSGGCIAVAVPLMLRDAQLPQIAGIISINPVLNTHRWANRQVHDCPKEYQDEMFFFTSNYFGDQQDVQPEYASPLMTRDVSGLPPAVFFAAKADPLAAEADQMHNRLMQAGIPSYIHIDEFAIHGSIRARHYYRFARNAYDALLSGIKQIIKE